jgi:hypothetical protein
MKETLKEMEARHSKEFKEFRKNCKHKKLIVLETSVASCGMKSPLRDRSVWKAISEHKTLPDNEYELEGYECILVTCKECGEPLLCIDHHGLSVYIQPHYMTKGLVIPPDPFDRVKE